MALSLLFNPIKPAVYTQVYIQVFTSTHPWCKDVNLNAEATKSLIVWPGNQI